jgi:ABC-type phosphate transport system ATPase subunit
VQSPQLTVRETILFSARLRLEPSLVETDHEKQFFVDNIIKDAELTSLADALVGTDEGTGLSFEQKKRLSIAVELAASPSVIFLDEVSPVVVAVLFGWSPSPLTNIAFLLSADEWIGLSERAFGC